MSTLLELLGNGLEQSLMELVIPGSRPLEREEAQRLAAAVAEEPGHRANRLRLAMHYGQSGRGEQARAMLRELVDGSDAEVHLVWAAVELLEASTARAQEQLEAAYGLAAGDSRVLYGMGHCCERRGEVQAAAGWYEQACAGRPYLRCSRERLGALALQEHDYEGAIGHYEALVGEHPEEVGYYLVLGELLLAMGREEEAQERFERALTIEPDNFELRDDEIEELSKAGRYEEAMVRVGRLIEEQGDFPDHYLRLGELYGLAGNDVEAVRNFERALELHPGYLEAAVKLGTQHLRHGRHWEAAGAFNRAVEINDRLVLSYVALGVAQHRLGDEAAVDTCELAGALEPNTNLLFAEIARLGLRAARGEKRREGSGDGGECLDDLLDVQIERHRQRVAAAPGRAELHYRYGLLLRTRGRTEEAAGQFRAAVEIDPAYPRARVKLGLALRELGRGEEAWEHFEGALRVEPESVELHYRLAVMWCDRMLFALAVEHFEQTVALEQRAGLESNLRLALQNVGLVDAAAASWQGVCELDPESTVAFRAQRAAVALRPLY